MPLSPLYFITGICKSVSNYGASNRHAQTAFGQAAAASAGRFVDGYNVRFYAGYPEKLGGWTRYVPDPLAGVPRGLWTWSDLVFQIYTAAGTNSHLYILYNDTGTVLDATPFRVLLNGVLTNPLTTTNGSSIVNVESTAHEQRSGDYVQLTAADMVDGVQVANTYYITVVDPDNYTIDTHQIATGSTPSAGGAVTYNYYRKDLTDPFTTVSGSPTVTVTDDPAADDTIPGDTVIYDGATAVGGLTLDGPYVVTTVTPSLHQYTIDAGENASSSATGGGTVSVEYEINIGPENTGNGYGIGFYGIGGYGQSQPSQLYLARVWSLQNYGQLLFASPTGGTIYIWDPTIGGHAYPMYGAPEFILAMFITHERFVIALGANNDYMSIAWPSQNNYNDWTPTPTNTAEDRDVSGGSFMVGGIPLRDGVNLFFSNTTCFTMIYSGDNNVYATNYSSDGCGLNGPLAVTALGGVAFWMSDADFFTWNGSTQPLPSNDIRSWVFTTKDGAPGFNYLQRYKCVAGTNREKKEVWFLYPSADSGEVDRGVIYNTEDQSWSIVDFGRTSWQDSTLLQFPMACAADGRVFLHEDGVNDDGGALDSYIEFGFTDLANGQFATAFQSFWPDFQRISGDVTLNVLYRDYPMGPATATDGPHTIAADGSTPTLDFQVESRMISYSLRSFVVDGDYRVGLVRSLIQGGAGRL